MSALDLSIVIVNWNTRDLLRHCLASLSNTTGVSCETIVVDNGSTDGSLEMLKARFPEVRVISKERNIGFAAANNCGLAQARGRYCLLLNSDTRVDPDTLTRMVQFMDNHSVAGACGPQLLNADGTLQPSGRGFPTLASALGELLPMPEGWRQSLRGKEQRRDYNQACQVDEVSGAALCLRRKALHEIGLLDDEFFFLGEDIDLCWRLKRAGWKVFYVPDARVMHLWGGSRNKTDNYAISLLSQRAYYLLFRKHRSNATALLLKAILFLLTLLKLVKWLVRSAVHRDARLARQVAVAHGKEWLWMWGR
jgi:GT2 family glycosyltransferase